MSGRPNRPSRNEGADFERVTLHHFLLLLAKAELIISMSLMLIKKFWHTLGIYRSSY
jgi:hypothetical protein